MYSFVTSFFQWKWNLQDSFMLLRVVVVCSSRCCVISRYINIPQFVCFLVDGHLGCLLLWAIISNTAQTFHTYFGRQIHSFVLAISRSRIAGSQGICFDLADIAKTFHQRVVQMFTPIRSVRMLQLLHILLMFGIVSLFHCNHSYGVWWYLIVA